MGKLILTDQLVFDLKTVHTTALGHNVFEIKGPQGAYIIEVLSVDFDKKAMLVRYQHGTHELVFKNDLDVVLDNMGISRNAEVVESTVKAPMPGKILEIMVEMGQEVQVGDPLLVLEAMKMENVLKSTFAGNVYQIMIASGDNVDKNQNLIEFVFN